jgi:hypothetical protein
MAMVQPVTSQATPTHLILKQEVLHMAVADKIVEGKAVALVDWSFDSSSFTISKDFFTKAMEASTVTYKRVVRPALTPEQLELYPEKLDLDVTMMDIYQGVRGNPHRCAVALAVGRRFDGAECSVNGGSVLIVEDHNGPVMVRYEDPSGALSQFISRFDHPFASSISDYGYAPHPTTLHLVRSAERLPQRYFSVLGDIS